MGPVRGAEETCPVYRRPQQTGGCANWPRCGHCAAAPVAAPTSATPCGSRDAFSVSGARWCASHRRV
eukprot:3808543-Lingulodinium_polyedra.AAC.1